MVYGPIPEQFLKNRCLWEAYAGSFWEGLQPVEKTSTGAGEESEDEGTAEKKHYGLIVNPIPSFLVPLRGEEVEKSGWGNGVFSLFFISHCSSLLVLSSKLC